MTTALIALVAALVAALFAWLLARGRGGAVPQGGLGDAIAEMNARIEAMTGELASALERVQEEGRRSRVLGELAGSIDLDEVLQRTLEAAGAVPGADAAMIALDDEEPAVVATLGIAQDEAARHIVGGPPDGARPRVVSVTYSYGPDEPEHEGGLLHSGLAVPLESETGPFGYLSVFSRARSVRFGDEQERELAELALRAGPAIDNARRFREARQLADLDALTGLHNRRYFHETLAREVSRAHRYKRSLALIIFDLDDFKAINDRIGHLAGDAVLAEAAERMRDVVRSADIACRVGGDEFAVIMPESTVQDADLLYKRLEAAISSRAVGQAGRIHISAGVTELKPEDDAVTFFERADEALYRAKGAGKGTVVAATWPQGLSRPSSAPESASSS